MEIANGKFGFQEGNKTTPNQLYKQYKNAGGDGSFKDWLVKTGDKLTALLGSEPPEPPVESKDDDKPEKTTIMGMNPYLFAGITVTVIVLAGIGIFKVMKKKN